MKNRLSFVAALLCTLLAGGFLYAQQVEIYSARSSAIGGLHVALADDLDALFANPAGFRSAKPGFTIAELALGLSGPIFDIASVIIEASGAAPEDLIADPEVQDLLRNLYSALNLAGPIAFGYVGNGLGFGFFNRNYVDVSTRGIVPSVSTNTGEAFIFAAGYSLRIPLPASWKSSLDVGASVHASVRGETSIEKDLLGFFGSISDPAGLILDAPFTIGLGVGFDAGLRYSFKDRFVLGVVGRNLYAPVLYYDYSSWSGFTGAETPVSSTGLDPIDLSAGLLFQPSLGRLGRYVSGLKIMLDYEDILDFLTHPATSTNPVLHAGLGMELVLLEILSLRAGFYQGLPNAGLGFKLGVCTLDLAMFGSELSPEPGLRPVFNLLLELSFKL